MSKNKNVFKLIMVFALFFVFGAGVFLGVNSLASQNQKRALAADGGDYDVVLGSDCLQIDGYTLKGLNEKGRQQVEGGKTYRINLPSTVSAIDGNGNASYFDEKLVFLNATGTTLMIIGDYAFYNCTGLKTFVTTANWQDRVEFSVGNHAFDGCSALTDFAPETYIPDPGGVYLNNVSSFGDYSFANCTSINKVKRIYDELKNLGNHTFEGCESLTEFDISNNNLTTLGESVFENCTSLITFLIDENITSVGNSAFKGCSSLKAINISKNLTHLGSSEQGDASMFEGCTSLECVIAEDKSHMDEIKSNAEKYGISNYIDQLTHVVDVVYLREGPNDMTWTTHKKLYKRSVNWTLSGIGWYETDYSMPTEGQVKPAFFDNLNRTVQVDEASLEKRLQGSGDTITLKRKMPLSYYKFEISWKEKEFNTQVQLQTLSTDGSNPLKLNTDYTADIYLLGKRDDLSQKVDRNALKDAGYYCYLLEANPYSDYCYGSYGSGFNELNFQIKPIDIGNERIELTSNFETYTFTYDGLSHKPTVELTFNYAEDQKYKLIKDLDYYDDQLEEFVTCGEHSFIISTPAPYTDGRFGNFTGTRTLTITIEKVLIGNKKNGDQYTELIVRPNAKSLVYTGKQLSPKFQFVLEDQSSYGGVSIDMGYFDMYFSENRDAGTYTARATAKDNNPYVTGEFEFEYEITPADMNTVTVETKFEDVLYDGMSHKPTSKIFLDDVEIFPHEYNIVYDDNTTDAGHKNVTFVSNSTNFTGSKTVGYYILQRNVEEEELEIQVRESSIVYRGSRVGIVFDHIWISVGDRKLSILPSDYSIPYAGNNTNVIDNSFVELVMKDGGNYTGRIRYDFKITPAQMSNVRIVGRTQTYFDGKEHRIGGFTSLELGEQPTVYTLKDIDYDLLFDEGGDYTNCGSKNVTIKARSKNFEGEITNKYSITQRMLSIFNPPYEIKVNIGQTPVYTGLKIEPQVESVQIKFTKDDDDYYTMPKEAYTVSYGEGNINADSSATLIIKAVEGSNFSGEYTHNFTIARRPVDDPEVVISEVRVVYDGKLKLPEPQLSINDIPFVSGKDFSVECDGYIDAGTYQYTIKGIGGNLTGNKTVNFVIERRSISDARIEYTGYGGSSIEYNGYDVMPEITVTIVVDQTNTLTLSRGSDYSVEYSNNLNVGQAMLTITGVDGGNYIGSASSNFNITPGTIEYAYMNLESIDYDGKEHKVEPAVYVGGVLLQKDVDYTISYDNDMTNAGVKTVTITAITGEGRNLRDSQAVRQFTINPIYLNSYPTEITFVGGSSFEYTGSKIMPAILLLEAIVNGERVAINAIDYEVEYGDNLNVGIGTVIITGKYDYLTSQNTTTYNSNVGGSYTYNFNITPLNITSRLRVTLEHEEYSFTGGQIIPVITNIEVIDGGQVTLQRSDYSIYYGSNRDVGQGAGSVRIEANYNSNITGWFVTNFDIVAINMQDVTITAPQDITFDGNDHKPSDLTVMIGGNRLTKDYDYQLTFNSEEYINHGEKSITVRSKTNNIIGDRTITFTIEKLSLDGKTIEFELENANYLTYTGSQIAPRVLSIKVNLGYYDRVEFDESDYDVSYGENINAGAGAIIVTAKADANFTGSCQKEIYINMAYNELTGNFSIPNFKTGENVTEPVAVPKFGTATIVYDDFNGHTYTFSQLRNANPGHYRATVKVDGTSNYYEFVNTFEFDILDSNGNVAGGGGNTGNGGNNNGGNNNGGGNNNNGGGNSNNGQNNGGGGGGAIIAIIAGVAGVAVLASVIVIVIKVKKKGKSKKA